MHEPLAGHSVEQRQLREKVVFPLEILPWVTLGSTLFHAVVNLSLNWTVVLLLCVLLPLVILTMGLSWLLASLGVYVRDVGQITGIVTTAMLFLTSIVYPLSALPEAYRPLLYLNPLTFIVEQGRGVLIWGNMPDWTGLGVYLFVSFLIAWLGFAWVQLTRRGFADVI